MKKSDRHGPEDLLDALCRAYAANPRAQELTPEMLRELVQLAGYVRRASPEATELRERIEDLEAALSILAQKTGTDFNTVPGWTERMAARRRRELVPTETQEEIEA